MMNDNNNNNNNNNDCNNNSSSNNNDLYSLGFMTSSFEEFGQQGDDEMAALGSEPPPEIQRRHGGVRDRIASHPLFPKLLDTYLDCRKVGAPSEIATELEEIRRDNNGEPIIGTVTSDPDLDYFMETYCEILEKYKSDLARPFDEATSFLSEMQAQLNDLISINNPPPASTSYVSDHEALGDSLEEELIRGDEIEHISDFSRQLMANEERELKHKLLHKYSAYISTLRHEFSKKKIKGKLPKEAKQVLLDWWALHYRWPYPMEGDKIALGELTGLDQKQINNWFINQRKRHWNPPENMHAALMDAHSLYGSFSHH